MNYAQPMAAIPSESNLQNKEAFRFRRPLPFGRALLISVYNRDVLDGYHSACRMYTRQVDFRDL